MEDKNNIGLDENTGATPIQHRIEMAVTNGRGYLEKGQTTYGSLLLSLVMPGYQMHPDPKEVFAEQLKANPNNLKLEDFNFEDWVSGYVVLENGHFVFKPARGVRR